jgi:hypothetical protein
LGIGIETDIGIDTIDIGIEVEIGVRIETVTRVWIETESGVGTGEGFLEILPVSAKIQSASTAHLVILSFIPILKWFRFNPNRNILWVIHAF